MFGYSLGFFEGDYAPIGRHRASSPITTAQFFTPLSTTSALGRGSKDLWNGNIRHMVTAIQPFMAFTGMPQARVYKYDQLNRLADAYTYDSVQLDSNLWKWTDAANPDYEEHFTYDANGNINTLSRNGTAYGGSSLDMDDFDYHYVSGTNRLNYVDDSKSSGNYSDDIDDQASNNYDYDEIGNLISDDAEEIATIEWTVYGKIAGITRSGGSKPDLEYEYSPDGHRVSKKVINADGNITITYYIRDAQGNTMSTYTRYLDTEEHDTFTWKEAHIYGSSRLGVYNADKVLVADETPVDNPLDDNEFTNIRGRRNYELSNHLGNVLAVITDRRTGICESETIASYEAEIIDATDYYAFGSPMPGRKGIMRCVVNPDTTVTTTYDINEAFTGTSNVGTFNAVTGGTTLSNAIGTSLTVTSVGVLPAADVAFTMVSGRAYTLKTDFLNMSAAFGYTSTILCEVRAGGFVIASQSYTTTSTTYTLNFTGTYNGTAYIRYTAVMTANPGPPPPPAFPPFFYNIDNVQLYYKDTTYGYDTVCTLDPNGYRYGFNGMEKDNEHNVEGGDYDFGARIYDSRLGRWLSLDALQASYPFFSPYVFCGNNPIYCIDPDGKDGIPYNLQRAMDDAAILQEAGYKTIIQIDTDGTVTLKWYAYVRTVHVTSGEDGYEATVVTKPVLMGMESDEYERGVLDKLIDLWNGVDDWVNKFKGNSEWKWGIRIIGIKGDNQNADATKLSPDGKYIEIPEDVFVAFKAMQKGDITKVFYPTKVTIPTNYHEHIDRLGKLGDKLNTVETKRKDVEAIHEYDEETPEGTHIRQKILQDKHDGKFYRNDSFEGKPGWQKHKKDVDEEGKNE